MLRRTERGGRLIRPDGYVAIRVPSHPHADSKGYLLGHILVVETARHGKRLPAGAEIHHVDGDRTNNTNKNLVVCQNTAYHKLLHIRQIAKRMCGNANWRECPFCHTYDDPANMVNRSPTGGPCHRSCKLAANRAKWLEKHPNARPRLARRRPEYEPR